MLFHPHCYIQKKNPEWNHLVHLICVCEHVCAQVCIFWSVHWRCEILLRMSHGHTLNRLTWVCPQCYHNVSTPVNVNAVLVGFFFDSFYFLHHFVFVRMQMSLIKFLLLKKKKKAKKKQNKKQNIVGFVCSIALISVAKPTCHGKETTQQVGFWSKIRGVICKLRNTVIVVKLENHSK